MTSKLNAAFASAALFAIGVVACGSPDAKAPVGTSNQEVAPGAGGSEKKAESACDQIDERCDPFEKNGGLAKECHDLSEGPNAKEEVCEARKAECFAACAPASK